MTTNTGTKPLQRALKRMLDILASAVGLLVLSPVLAFVAVLVAVSMGRPILLRQVRAGRDEKPFRLVKFRTMTNDRGPDGTLLPDEVRITRIGRFLRTCSLDELPQLWNVLAGELSLVGPRPLPLRYLPRYSPRQRLRHAVRPGVTGLAQVSGRVSLDWEPRLELDVQYCESFSLWLDCQILWRTAWTVLSRTGVNEGPGLDDFWGAAGKPSDSPDRVPLDENEYV